MKQRGIFWYLTAAISFSAQHKHQVSRARRKCCLRIMFGNVYCHCFRSFFRSHGEISYIGTAGSRLNCDSHTSARRRKCFQTHIHISLHKDQNKDEIKSYTVSLSLLQLVRPKPMSVCCVPYDTSRYGHQSKVWIGPKSSQEFRAGPGGIGGLHWLEKRSSSHLC